MNLSLSRVTNSSRRPMYSHVMALVGRKAQAIAAIARPNLLDTDGILLEDGRKQGQ